MTTLSSHRSFSPAELDAVFTTIRWNNPAAEELHCQMVVPTAWHVQAVDGTSTSENAVFRPLIRAWSDAKPTAMVELSAQTISCEITPSDFLAAWMQATSRKLVDMRDITTPAGPAAESLGQFTRAGETFLERTFLLKSGNRIFLLRGLSSASDYQAFEDIFCTCFCSFMPLRPPSSDAAEPFHTVSIGDAGFQVQIPTNWHCERPFQGSQNEMQLANVAYGTEVGRIRLVHVPGNLDARHQLIVESVLRQWVGPGGRYHGAPLLPGTSCSGASCTHLDTTGSLSDGSSIEIWIKLYDFGTSMAVLSALVASRTVDPVLWAIHRGTFRRVADTLTPIPSTV